MKYFCLIFTLIFTLADYGISDKLDDTTYVDPCTTEIDTNVETECAHKAHVREMDINYIDYRDNKINRDGFKERVDNFCGRMLSETRCILDNVLPKISDACNTSSHYDSVLVMAKYNNIFTDYYCVNNQTRYMDTIEDDGVNCMFNRNSVKCSYSRILKDYEFISVYVCELLDTNIACENFVDNCINQHVKTYRVELYRLLKQKFDC